MRLVLVHGINNQNNSAEAIRADWTRWMADAAGHASGFDGVDVLAPFYGKALKELESGPIKPDEVISQGIGDLDDEEAMLVSSAMAEVALAAGLSQAAINREVSRVEATEMGVPPHDRTFIAIIRLIQKLSPLQGDVAMRLLNQAFVYLKRDWAAKIVDDIVAPAFEGPGPFVVVSHSLGTIVTYKLLRDFAKSGQARDVQLYVTMGSPLAIRTVQSSLGKPRHRPPGVVRWLNARELDDFVTLGVGLTEETFAPKIENIEVTIDGADAHSIKGYLADHRIGTDVLRALN
jgi:hypothetical protein